MQGQVGPPAGIPNVPAAPIFSTRPLQLNVKKVHGQKERELQRKREKRGEKERKAKEEDGKERGKGEEEKGRKGR